MPGRIFLLDPAGELTEMAETTFAAKIDLRQSLAAIPVWTSGRVEIQVQQMRPVPLRRPGKRLEFLDKLSALSGAL